MTFGITRDCYEWPVKRHSCVGGIGFARFDKRKRKDGQVATCPVCGGSWRYRTSSPNPADKWQRGMG